MPSPFPGMDPFLEHLDYRQSLHAAFAGVAQLELGAKVGPNYACRVEETLSLHELSAGERRLVGRGDVTVHDADGVPTFEKPSSGSAASATVPPLRRVVVPAVVVPAVDVERLRRVELRDRRTRRVVTVIELLGPTNKRPGPDRDQYLAKRRALLEGGASLVEIDLLRGWPRMPVDRLPECDYLILVSRPWELPVGELWPVSVRDPLPPVPIPLRREDGDVPFDLRGVLDRLYDASGYGGEPYEQPPDPPLSDDDAAWAAGVLADAGLTPPAVPRSESS